MNNPNALVEFQEVLAKRKTAIASRLPSHMRDMADRMVKIALATAVKNPRILDCSQESVMMSIMQAAELGLEPGGSLGEGYLVPYGSTCQFIPGYRGLISLARRSGQIESVRSHIVRERDVFDYELGLVPVLVHRPYIGAEDAGAMTFVYGVAQIKGGGIQPEGMSKSEVEAIRKRSKAATSGPWVTDYTEMARKTVIRRLFKYLPVSVEMCRALEIQAQAEAGDFDASKEVLNEYPQIDDANARAQELAANRTKAAPVAGLEGMAS